MASGALTPFIPQPLARIGVATNLLRLALRRSLLDERERLEKIGSKNAARACFVQRRHSS